MFDINRYAAVIAVCLALLTLAARLAAAVARVHRATHPRLAAAIEALGAASPDPVRVGVQLYEALTGRRLPPAWVLLGDVLQGRPTPPSSPPGDASDGRPTMVPGDRPPGDEMTRAGRRGMPGNVLGAACLALVGCGHVDAAGASLAAATTAVKAATMVRRYLCARELDPLLGDPRAPEASAPTSGGSAPSSPAPAPTPPPAVPPAPVVAPATEADGDVPNDAAVLAGMDGG